MPFIRKLYNRISQHMVNMTEQSSRQIVTFGILMALNHPLYQLIWSIESAKNYQNTYLRLIATVLSLLIAVSPYWPQRVKRLLPLVWYLALCFCLPFFFTFMSLKSHLGAVWMMNSMSALFFMFLLIDFFSASVLIVIGVFFGVWAFDLTSTEFIIAPGIVTINGLLATFGAAFVIGGIFARNNEIIRQEKFATLHSLSASVAHEFRTPLAAIKFAMAGLEKFLPKILFGYKQALDANLEDVEKVRKNNLALLENLPQGIDKLLYQANMSIDIMLMNATQLKINSMDFKKTNIDICLFKALERYPFKSGKQKELVNVDSTLYSFDFLGNELLVMHVFYNLMKNAFYFIDAMQKGEIYIWTESYGRYNKLYFRDTSKGMNSDELKSLFKQFHSRREGGTGVGLSYCKRVMEAINGDITCYAEEGVHTTFILYFPRLVKT